jgi:hypothetical protein
MSQTSTNTLAHKVLETAHNHGYHYPENFGGFKATIRYSTDDKTLEGNVTVHSPNDIKLELEGQEGELKVIQREIASLCGHRWHAPYSAGDGRYTLSLDESPEHPLGQLITFHDDPFKSSYRIKDGSIVQVNRLMGPTRFTLYVQEHVSTEGNSQLPSQFTLAFWDTEQKKLVRTLVYTDHYVPIAGYYLPASRRILTHNDEGASTQVFAFSAHEIL